ncbi:hypothetical protein TBK1r_15630 [Stieleria magnilauensis]|uniref:Uncharacterized protein n=1 Tax=Stieleria magnilauensis TaxID=2527963 RepID=A0ABX5XLB0_9BACT|nr:hypothetical protein TBK1r_15630 [Planctomycetes bacterium TBK1r]
MCSVGLVFQEKKNTLRPHDASDGGAMRLRFTQWATRDQDGARTKTLTTCGQRIQEAGASLAGWSHAFAQPIDTARQASKWKAIRLSSTTVHRTVRAFGHDDSLSDRRT